MWPERTGSLKIFEDPTRNRTQKFLSRDTVPLPNVPPLTPLNKTAYGWMILNHQLERMWKKLAMVQIHIKHLVEENEESNDSLSGEQWV